MLTWCLQPEVQPTQQLDASGSTKARTKQGVSQLPTGRNAQWHITEIDQVGEPLTAKKATVKYKTVIGALVRDYIPIKYRNGLRKMMTRGGFLKVRRITYGILRSQSISLSQRSMTRS